MSRTRIAIAVLLGLGLSACGGSGSGTPDSSAATDAALDTDGDGISNASENADGSDPRDPDDPVPWGNRDHDRDGVPNGADDDFDPAADPDTDGLSSDREYALALDPMITDWVVHERRRVSVVGSDAETLVLELRTPHGLPLKNAAVTPIPVASPKLLQPIYPAKGWLSDESGIIEAQVNALGTGEDALLLVRGSTGQARRLSTVDTVASISLQDPADSERRFSSVLNGDSPGSGFAQSRINSARAWVPQETDGAWLDIPVSPGERPLAVWVRGRADASHWVEQLRVSAELQRGLRQFAHGGASLDANTDRNTPVRIALDLPTGIDAVRLHPISWEGVPALRAALEVAEAPADSPRDSDGDGLSDAIEALIGTDAGRDNDPRLRDASDSFVAHATADSGDGVTARWRAVAGDPAPWIELGVPEGEQLVGLRLHSDAGDGATVSQWLAHDATPPGALSTLNGGIALPGSAAQSHADRWLADAGAARRIRLTAIDWQVAADSRIQLWTRRSPSAPGGLHDDPDRDGLYHIEELARGLDPLLGDSDGDGLDDGAEIETGTDPLLRDSDGDGLADALERRLAADPLSTADGALTDNDNDGLSDALESLLGTDPQQADTDADGLSDEAELALTRTDPLLADSDDDTLLDGEEHGGAGNPRHPALPAAQPRLDADGDGLNAAREAWLGSDPGLADSDGDGLRDAAEVAAGSDPTDADSPTADGASDADGDGRPLAAETADGSDPADGDSPIAGGAADLDGDGTPNGADPDYAATADHDGDGRINRVEYQSGTAPDNPDDPVAGGAGDHDDDGTPNGSDTDYAATPGLDSDADGLEDTAEFSAGSDPHDGDSPLVGGAADLDGDTIANGADADYDPTGDADGDGFANGFEYRAGTDPSIANTATDYPSPSLVDNGAGSPLQHFSLPDPGTGAPFYSGDPAWLSAVLADAANPIERVAHDGFSGNDISIVARDGESWLINATPRPFTGIGLQLVGEAEPRWLSTALAPFSEARLPGMPADAAVLIPGALGEVQVTGFTALNSPSGPKRVSPESIDDYQRLALAAQRRFNRADWWQSVDSGIAAPCAASLCSDDNEARSTLAQLFDSGPAASLGIADPAIRGDGWQAQPATALTGLATFGAQQLAGAGLADPVLAGLFAPARSAGESAELTRETARNRPIRERAALHALTADSANRQLRLRLYSRDRLAAVRVFSPVADLDAAQYDGPSGEFVFTLSQAAWDDGRLWVLFEAVGGETAASLALSW